jgi:hypothetical protein
VVVKRMQDSVGGSLKTTTKGVVLTGVVVIPHFGFGWSVNGCLGLDVDVLAGCTTLVFDVVAWVGTTAVFPFGDVDFCFPARTFGFTSGLAFDLELDVGVLLERCLVAISGEFYLGEAVAFTFFVHPELFLAARTVFLFVATSGRQRGREGRVAFFLTFPSDALGGDFSFDSGDGSPNRNVVPVRRWKEAERDRDSGVKVQIGWCEGESGSRMPFEVL